MVRSSVVPVSHPEKDGVRLNRRRNHLRGGVYWLLWALIFTLTLLGGVGKAQAATFTWTGAISTAWSNSGNWNPTGVPGSADIISISSGTIDLEAVTRTVSKLNMTGGAIQNGTLTLTSTTSASNWSNGTISSTLNVNSGVTMNFGGGFIGGTVNNNGTFNWLSSAGGVGQNTGSVFNNNAAGVFNCNANTNWFNNGSGSQNFNNKGTFNRSGAGTSSFLGGVNFNNTLTVNCTAGILSLTDGTSSGTFNAVSPGEIDFASSVHTLSSGAKFTGTGVSQIINGGTVSLNTGVVGGSSGGIFRLNGGTLTSVPAGGTITGTLSITGGFISGTVSIASGGTATWTGSGSGANVGQNTSAVFNVNAGGTFNAQSDAVWYNNGSGSQNFNVKGTLNRTGAGTSSTFNPGINFNNTGTTNCTSGTLSLSSGTSSGTFTTGSSGVTNFFGDTHTLTKDATNPTGADFTGAGISSITGGTVVVDETIVGSNGGTLKLAGGTLSSPVGETGTISGGITLDSGFVSNSIAIGGTATWTGASGIGQNTGSVFTVNAGGTFNAQSNAVWFNNGSGSQTFAVKGTLTKTGGSTISTFNPGINFNNTATVNATSGTLAISDGTSSGTFNAVSPGAIIFNQGGHTLTGGAKFTGTGSTDITGGTVSISGTIVGGSSGGRLRLNGGTLNGAGTGGTVSGILTIVGGFVNNTINIASGGTANWIGVQGPGNVGQNTGSVFNVNAGGTFNAQSDAVWYNNGSGSQNFNVKGTLTKTGTGTNSSFLSGVNFNNTGTVNSTTGTLSLSNGTSSGTFNVVTGAQLLFIGSCTLTKDATNTAGAKFTGTGSSDITSGVVTISTNIVGNSGGGSLKLLGGTLAGAPGSVTGGITLVGGFISGTVNVASGGTATWIGNGSSSNIGQNTSSVFDVNAGGTFNAQAQAVWYNNGSGSQTFNVKGTLTKSGAGTTSTFNPGINFNNTGTVNSTSGLLELSDGSSSGTFNAVLPGAINFPNGTHTLSGGAKFTGTGASTVTFGTVNINGTIVGGTGGGTFQLNGGTLTTPAGGGTVSGVLTLVTGSVAGTINIPSGGIVNWIGNGGGGSIAAGTNSIFNVKAGAIFNCTGSANWFSNGTTGSQSFNMSGTMNLAGTGDTTIGIKFVETSTSLLNLRIGGETAGTQFDRLNLTGPSCTLSGALDLGLINGFVPAAGTNFQVIPFNGPRTGTFSFVSSPFTATYNPNDVTVSTPATASLYVKVNPEAFLESSANGTVVGTVTRTGSTAASLSVALTNSNTGKLTIPASVSIPAGQASANFAVTLVNGTTVDGNAVATITASASGFNSGTTRVSIIDDDAPKLTVAVTPASFAESAADGTVTGTVTRNTSTASALTVTVSSSNTNKVKVSTTALPTPAASVSVTIPAGSTSAAFRLHAIDNSVKDGNTNVVITGSASNFTSGTKTVTVTDDDNGNLTLTINAPTSFAENASVGGAAATTAKVALDSTNANPVVVTVTSSNANKVTFTGATVDNSTNPPKASATVTIAAGTLNKTFNVLAVNNNVVDGNFNVTITVAAPTYVQDSDSVTVTDNDSPVLSLTVNPSIFGEDAGNSAAVAAISRNTTNNAAALAVTVVSSNANKVTFSGAVVNNTVTPPTATVTVNIAAGAASANLTVRAVNNAVLDGNFAVSLTASASGFLSSSAGVTVTDDEAANQFVSPHVTVAGVSLSVAQAVASSDYVTLTFTGTLSGVVAGDPSHYSVLVNGEPVAVQSAAYSTATNQVTLDLGEGAFEAGDDVYILWQDLSDSKGKVFSGQVDVMAQ